MVIALNRDEFYDRPTEPATFWSGHRVLAGKDCDTGGTWFGLTRSGRIGLVTNFRTARPDSSKRSRAFLVPEYLKRSLSGSEYAHEISSTRQQYRPFNLLVGDANALFYVCSETGERREITSGLFGLSNGILGDCWPKIKKGLAAIERLSAESHNDVTLVESLLAILSDKSVAPDDELPNTGVGFRLERELSPIYVEIPWRNYGTRSSTIVLVDQEKNVTFVERSYATRADDYSDVCFNFPLRAATGEDSP